MSRNSFESDAIRYQGQDRSDQEVEGTLAKAAATISELVKHNQILRAEAEATIAELRRTRATEKERSENLKAGLEATLAEGDRVFQDNERILRDLAAEKRDLEDQVEKSMDELASVKQRLENLSSNWRTQLKEAIRKADDVNRQK